MGCSVSIFRNHSSVVVFRGVLTVGIVRNDVKKSIFCLHWKSARRVRYDEAWSRSLRTSRMTFMSVRLDDTEREGGPFYNPFSSSNDCLVLVGHIWKFLFGGGGRGDLIFFPRWLLKMKRSRLDYKNSQYGSRWVAFILGHLIGCFPGDSVIRSWNGRKWKRRWCLILGMFVEERTVFYEDDCLFVAIFFPFVPLKSRLPLD